MALRKPSQIGLVTTFALLALCSLAGCNGADRNVWTQHNDNFRTGAYLAETTLTPKSVGDRGMHVKYWVPPCRSSNPDTWNRPGSPAVVAHACLDGSIVTQPLYVTDVRFQTRAEGGLFGATRIHTANGLFVATQNNFVYGLQAETGEEQWHLDLMDTIPERCSPDPNAFHPMMCLWPNGVHATPVIDVAQRRMYVLFSTRWEDPGAQDCTVSGGPAPQDCQYIYYLRRHAAVAYWLAMLDINTGQVVRKVRVSGSATATNGASVKFDEKRQSDHPALLLDHGSVYVAFGAIAFLEGLPDYQYQGWVMRFGASDLSAQSVFCTCPQPTPVTEICPVSQPNPAAKSGGSGIWQGGGGLAADTSGNVYFLTGNGRAEIGKKFYGDSFVKLLGPPYPLYPVAFTPPAPHEQGNPEGKDALDCKDADLGAGGTMMIPDTNLVIGGGKPGIIHVLDTGTMSSRQWFEASTNQYLPSMRAMSWKDGPHLHGSPTFWRGLLYVWGEKDFLKAYQFDQGTGKFVESRRNPMVPFPTEVKPLHVGKVKALEDTMPGGMLSVSANGKDEKTGIVWATLPDSDCTPNQPCPMKPPGAALPGWLYAFNAETLEPLWDGGFGGIHPHWALPTVANGMVFVPYGNEFAYGSEMLLAYELGARNGSERKTRHDHQPRAGWTMYPKCGSCHTQGETPEQLMRHASFAEEASLQMLSALAWKILTPPAGRIRSFVLQGNGSQTYKATEDHGKLVWSPQENTADLTEPPPDPDAAENQKNAMHVRLSAGPMWSASDGSVVLAQPERTVPAPQTTDADWVLFKIVKSSGQGILSGQSYIQRVSTHAGHAPTKRPRRKGEIVQVPYYAEYWLYR